MMFDFLFPMIIAETVRNFRFIDLNDLFTCNRDETGLIAELNQHSGKT